MQRSETHPAALASESIYLIREGVAKARNPIMLVSIGHGPGHDGPFDDPHLLSQRAAASAALSRRALGIPTLIDFGRLSPSNTASILSPEPMKRLTRRAEVTCDGARRHEPERAGCVDTAPAAPGTLAPLQRTTRQWPIPLHVPPNESRRN